MKNILKTIFLYDIKDMSKYFYQKGNTILC